MILYVGSYTEHVVCDLKGHGEGIYCFDFNEETGMLKLKHIEKNCNTSFLVLLNTIDRLYSFQETQEDKIPVALAYKINKDDSLSLLNKQPIKGGLPCHLDVFDNEKQLVISCYMTGNILTYPLDKEGKLEPFSSNFQHEGSSVNQERQEAPHAHMAFVDERKGQVLVPDLGTDTIEVYRVENSKLMREYGIKAPLGSGPRHLVNHPFGQYYFVMHELDGSVGVLGYKNDCLEYLGTYQSLPEDYCATPSGSTIKVSKDGRFVYAGNRVCDTIAIFRFDEKLEKLELIGQQSTFGKTPRDFEFSPSGEWLLVGNQDSDTIVVFKVNKETGKLTKVSENHEAKSPVCFKWKN